MRSGGDTVRAAGHRPTVTGEKRQSRRGQQPQGSFEWSERPKAEPPSAPPPVTAPDPGSIADATSESDGGSAPVAALGPASTAPDTEEFVSDREPYSPGHPWHYLTRGDNAVPLPADKIQASPSSRPSLDRDLPKEPVKRIVAARRLLDSERERLAELAARYEAVVEHGADALSRYDREIAYGGDLELARAGTIAILHNQIAWTRGRIELLETESARRADRKR